MNRTKFIPLSECMKKAMEEMLFPVPSVKFERFPRFSDITGGFRDREFTVLCGSTGSGKTTLLANWSASMIERKIPHFVLSIETGYLDFSRRVLSVFARKNLNTGEIVDIEDLRRVRNSHADAIKEEGCFLSVYDNRVSIETLISDIEEMVSRNKAKVVFVDNLNFFMEVTRSSDSIIEMDRVIHELIILCKQVDVHVVMVMHPRKTDNGRVTSLYDIKGSSISVQEAHNVFLWNRVDPALMRETTDLGHMDRQLSFAKMRRRGEYIGSELIFRSTDGVSYQEGKLYHG